jgi:ABC-type Fe3+-citrate transport system substrate-binding protein
MKKIIILTTLLIGSITVASAADINKLSKEEVKTMTDEERSERVIVLEERLMELSELDVKNMERQERREIKKEVKYIQKELKAHGNGGIYISSGAVILVLLLIIVL